MVNRNTIQRKRILDCINNCNYHLTVEDIYTSLNKEISIATIYRNVSYLTQKGEIRKVVLNNNKVVYDRIYKPHYHMQCNNCGEVIDIDLEYLDDVDVMASKQSGYNITGHDIVFFGTCSKCQ